MQVILLIERLLWYDFPISSISISIFNLNEHQNIRMLIKIIIVCTFLNNGSLTYTGPLADYLVEGRTSEGSLWCLLISLIT